MTDFQPVSQSELNAIEGGRLNFNLNHAWLGLIVGGGLGSFAPIGTGAGLVLGFLIGGSFS